MAKRRKTSTAPTRIEEVSDLEAEEVGGGSDLTIEVGIIFATFLALAIGVFLAQKVLADKFSMGFLA